MTKTEWLELAQHEILHGDYRKAIIFINEVIEMIKIEEEKNGNKN